jgi:uncharacterized OsmC-like protein
MATQQTINQVNGINLDILQETVKAIEQDPELGKCQFRASNKWISGDHNRTTITGFYGAKQEIEHQQPFEVDADEPPVLAGKDQAPNPAEHLLHSLAGCVTTGIVAHAAVRGIHIEQLESELEGDLDLRGFLGLSENVPKGFTNIRVNIKVKTDEDNLERLRELIDYSPVLNTITEGAKVDIRLESK